MGRSPIVRDLRVQDANMIMNHLPIIAAHLASPAATPEEVTEIANLVLFIVRFRSVSG